MRCSNVIQCDYNLLYIEAERMPMTNCLEQLPYLLEFSISFHLKQYQLCLDCHYAWKHIQWQLNLHLWNTCGQFQSVMLVDQEKVSNHLHRIHHNQGNHQRLVVHSDSFSNLGPVRTLWIIKLSPSSSSMSSRDTSPPSSYMF